MVLLDVTITPPHGAGCWGQGDSDLPGGARLAAASGEHGGGQRGHGQAWAEGCVLLLGPDVISDRIHHGLVMPSRWGGSAARGSSRVLAGSGAAEPGRRED